MSAMTDPPPAGTTGGRTGWLRQWAVQTAVGAAALPVAAAAPDLARWGHPGSPWWPMLGALLVLWAVPSLLVARRPAATPASSAAWAAGIAVVAHPGAMLLLSLPTGAGAVLAVLMTPLSGLLAAPLVAAAAIGQAVVEPGPALRRSLLGVGALLAAAGGALVAAAALVPLLGDETAAEGLGRVRALLVVGAVGVAAAAALVLGSRHRGWSLLTGVGALVCALIAFTVIA